MLPTLERLHQQDLITDLDLHFTRFLARQAESVAPEVLLAVCLASHWTGNGNICINLPVLAGTAPFADGGADGPVAPELPVWRKCLRASPVVGRPGEFRPLILDRRNRLYLYRYWDYEQRLAKALLTRARQTLAGLDESRLAADLTHLFGLPGERVDWQKIAAATALLRGLCVISGGPGTGKTTTVVRVLALLCAQQPERPPAVALAAPTGKAAARMQEAIRAARDRLDLSPKLAAAIPDQAQTLHRLLGPLPDGVGFRHGPEQPLPLDVLIVDEASMIDLALMVKLVEALPADARLILLGDKDQLASVEAGAVLGDICGAVPGFRTAFRDRLAALTGEPLPAGRDSASPLADCVVQLRRSYRFGRDSGIGRLARAVNTGRAAPARGLLASERSADLRWRTLSGRGLSDQLALRLAEGYGPYLRLLREGAPAIEIFAAFERFRVLCALRAGPFGVQQLNRLIEQMLARRRLIRPLQARAERLWYPGRPVMVTRNDYNLRLYNGDIGLALTDEAGHLRVWFQSVDGQLRRLAPGRLPPHETVFAMTVHKSQGSEFDQVLLVLPPDDNRILGRELLYTGITRARLRVEVWATGPSFDTAVARRVLRASGLRDALWRSARGRS